MEKRRPEFALLILCSCFLAFIILAFVMQGKIIEIANISFASLQVDQEIYPLKIAVVPFQVFLLALALICVNLVNEFFGKRETIYLALAGGGAICFVWLLLKGASYIPTVENQVTFDQAYATVFDLSKRFLLSFSTSIAVGFSFIALIFEFFRRLTRNGFAIIRLFMAHLVGLAFFVAIDAFWKIFLNGSLGEALAFAITRYIQWFFLSILLIPFYYLLKLPFRILVGKAHYEEVKERFVRKKMFGQEKKDFFESREELQANRI